MKNLFLLVTSSAALLTCFTESSHALSFLNPNIKEIKNVNNSKLSDALVEFKNKHEELVSQLTTENLEKDETIKSMQKKYYDETTNLKNKISHLHNVIKQQQDSINKQNVELQKYKSIVDQNQDMLNKISHLHNVIKQQQDSINKQNVELQKYKSEEYRTLTTAPLPKFESNFYESTLETKTPKYVKNVEKAMKRSYGDEYNSSLASAGSYYEGGVNPYESSFREIYNMRREAKRQIAEIERKWGSGGTAKASHTKSGTGTLLPPTGYGVGLFSRGG